MRWSIWLGRRFMYRCFGFCHRRRRRRWQLFGVLYNFWWSKLCNLCFGWRWWRRQRFACLILERRWRRGLMAFLFTNYRNRYGIFAIFYFNSRCFFGLCLAENADPRQEEQQQAYSYDHREVYTEMPNVRKSIKWFQNTRCSRVIRQYQLVLKPCG